MKGVFLRQTFFLLFGFICCIPFSEGQGLLDFNAKESKIYSLMFSGKLDSANLLLKGYQVDPNRIPTKVFLAHYVDFVTALVSEEKSLEERFLKKKDSYLKQLAPFREVSSPELNLILGDFHLKWAIMEMKGSNFFAGANEIRRANHYLNRNSDQFPSFVLNLKSLGMLHALVGTLPSKYAWIAKMVGLKGTLTQGRAELQKALTWTQEHNHPLRYETQVLLSYYYSLLAHNPKKALQTIERIGISPATSTLLTFFQVNIAREAGETDKVIKLLRQRPNSSDYFPMPIFHYQLGSAYLTRGDVRAQGEFEKYLSSFNANNLRRNTRLKLAWHSWLHDQDEVKYRKLLAKVLSEPESPLEDDEMATRYADRMITPHIGLLKARLFFDGAYYLSSLLALESVYPDVIKNRQLALEYYYRLARTYEKMGRHKEAKTQYLLALEAPNPNNDYFSCSAAVLLGQKYEKEQNTTLAKEYYRKALQMSPNDYKQGLHQKARAGLQRLRK